MFPATGITLSFTLQLVHRLPALSSSICYVQLMLLHCLTAALLLSSVRFLTWDSQLNEPKCRVITFCLFVSSDLCNAVFSCLMFAVEILDVNREKKKDTNDAVKFWEGGKTFKSEVFNCDFRCQKGRRKKAINRKSEKFWFCSLFIRRG